MSSELHRLYDCAGGDKAGKLFALRQLFMRLSAKGSCTEEIESDTNRKKKVFDCDALKGATAVFQNRYPVE